MMVRKQILLLLLLAAALVATVAYASQNADTRGSAAGNKIQLVFVPEVKKVKLGANLTVKVMIDTKGERLSGVDLRLKYDNALLEGLSFKPAYGCPSGKCVKAKYRYLFENKDDVVINSINQQEGYVNIAGVNMEKTLGSMPRQMVELGSITFKTIKKGEAKVMIDDNYENMISGYSLGKTSQVLEWEGGGGGSYTIGASGKCETTWRKMAGNCQEEEVCGGKTGKGKNYATKALCEKSR